MSGSRHNQGQKRAAANRALQLMTERGLSQNRACELAGNEFDASGRPVKRWAKGLGVDLSWANARMRRQMRPATEALVEQTLDRQIELVDAQLHLAASFTAGWHLLLDGEDVPNAKLLPGVRELALMTAILIDKRAQLEDRQQQFDVNRTHVPRVIDVDAAPRSSPSALRRPAELTPVPSHPRLGE